MRSLLAFLEEAMIAPRARPSGSSIRCFTREKREKSKLHSSPNLHCRLPFHKVLSSPGSSIGTTSNPSSSDLSPRLRFFPRFGSQLQKRVTVSLFHHS